MTTVSPELFKHIRRIQIRTQKLVNELFAGAYRSTFKGMGIEFEEVREYQPGDDTRSIDWNVTARMNRPYIKNFREERELTVMLVVDVSASSRFGSVNRSKSELIAELGAVLALSASHNNDKIGLILFSDQIEKYIPPRKGVRHVLRILRELLAFKPHSRGTDLKMALTFLGKVQRRTGICFLISDFICSDYSQSIKLTLRRYDLISIAISDPYELSLPSLALTQLIDLETGASALLDLSDQKLLDYFKLKAAERIHGVKRLIESLGGGFISLRTDESYSDALRHYFLTRKVKR
jgi:uncharacterized protein (DUF58 family)